MRLFLSIFLIFFIFRVFPLLGQTAFDSIPAQLIQGYKDAPSEMIYLQTSKDIYETGEDLWFKAYQLDVRDHSLSTGCKTLYLQVVGSESDSIVWQEKYPLVNGIANGHVYLDERLQEGTYILEAYTKNSFYSDSSAFSSIRKIRVVKNIGNIGKREEGKLTDSLRFEVFPEGGNLVSGVRSVVAFKATDGKGNPLDVSGELFENDSMVTDFKSRHDGMGQLSFTPSADKAYQIKLPNGERYPLPAIQTQGFGLHLLSQNKEFLEFIVYQSCDLPEQKIYILGQMRGTPCCLVKALIRDSLRIKIPIKETDFPVQGIAEFTLFDDRENPVAERLVFIHSDKELNISASFDKRVYVVRNKALLKLKITDENGNPVKAHLGVSIFDKAYSDHSYPVNIQTHCLLSSQIQGNIHNPYYYFDKENTDRKEALDLLLMTQGWRRYRWKYKKEDNPGNPLLSDEVNGVQTIKNKKMRNTEQMIQVFDAKERSGFIWADTLGHFSIDPEILYELRGGYLYVKPLVGKDNGPKLIIEDPFKNINSIRSCKQRYYPFIDTSRVKHDPIDREPLVNQFGTVLLKEVTVSAKSNKPLRDKYMGHLDSLAQINLGPWVCDCNKHPVPYFLNDYRFDYSHHPVGLLGSEYTGKKSYPIKGKTYTLIKYAPRGQEGRWYVADIKNIIYQGTEYSDEELLRMNNLWRIKGYYGEREFYMPNQMEMLSSLPDTRNTLLWNPSVITDDKGEVTLEFYTSDLNTGFVGRIEGIGDNGLLGVSQGEFNVIRYGQNE